MRRDSFNVLFFIKKTKLLKNGEASVCMRITVNGARVETNIRKSIEPVSWNQAKECARANLQRLADILIIHPLAHTPATALAVDTIHSLNELPEARHKLLKGLFLDAYNLHNYFIFTLNI